MCSCDCRTLPCRWLLPPTPSEISFQCQFPNWRSIHSIRSNLWQHSAARGSIGLPQRGGGKWKQKIKKWIPFEATEAFFFLQWRLSHKKTPSEVRFDWLWSGRWKRSKWLRTRTCSTPTSLSLHRQVKSSSVASVSVQCWGHDVAASLAKSLLSLLLYCTNIKFLESLKIQVIGKRLQRLSNKIQTRLLSSGPPGHWLSD